MAIVSVSHWQTCAMKKFGLIVGIVIGLTLSQVSFGQEPFNGHHDDPIKDSRDLEKQGEFKRAANLLRFFVADTYAATPEDKKRWKFELDRLDRIRKDFPYTKDALFAELKKSVQGLMEKEFDKWVADGWFDSREIDGLRYFMGSSVSNLFFRHAELNPRRIPLKDTAAHDQAVLEECRAIKAAADQEKKPYVLPKRFHVTMNVTAKADAAPEGKTVRAWLPIPRSSEEHTSE